MAQLQNGEGIQGCIGTATRGARSALNGSAMTLNVPEIHLGTDSNANPIGFSSINFKGIGGAWVGSISPQAVVRHSVVWDADVSANVYDATVAANPNEIKGKQHSPHPEGTYFGTVGDKEYVPTLLQIRSAGQFPVTELGGILFSFDNGIFG